MTSSRDKQRAGWANRDSRGGVLAFHHHILCPPVIPVTALAGVVMRMRIVLTVSALFCIQENPLAGQRPDFSALRDSLSGITDVPLLYRLEHRSA